MTSREVSLDQALLDKLTRLVDELNGPAEHLICDTCAGLTDADEIDPHVRCRPCALAECQRCREDWADDAADTAAVDAWGDR